MKSVVNSKKQEQYRKFMAKDTAFLKKIVGGEGSAAEQQSKDAEKIKI